VDESEPGRWLELADGLIDGLNPATGLYEEFAGFFELEPLLIRDISVRPITADLLLGRERVRGAQVVKQADVLMLHHLLPDEVAAGSLAANLDFYEPRTAHGSSLSPAIHAALFARAGRTDDALLALRIASRIDLDDLTQTGAGGVHLGAMGGVWQALAYGFAGLRPRGDALVVDPVLPDAWPGFEIRVRFRGVPLELRVEPDAIIARAPQPVAVLVDGRRTTCEVGLTRFERSNRRGAP
jgi:trehalose/maltose hydrolase-like predicted phosphorylase